MKTTKSNRFGENKYAIIDKNGKIKEKFRSKSVANEFLVELNKYDGNYSIIEIEG